MGKKIIVVLIYADILWSLCLSQLYVWPLLETLFSEVLTRDEWLRLFDNVFSNHPSFLLMACVAYVICCREPLLLCSQKQDFEVLFFFFVLPSHLFSPIAIFCFSSVNLTTIPLFSSISFTTVTT